MTTTTIRTVGDLRVRIAALGVYEPDPGRVAEKLLADLAPAEVRVVAEAALRDYARRVLTRPTPSPPQHATADGERTASARTAATIDWYATELRKPVHTAPGAWKHLGECTVDDLAFAVTSRRRKAEEVRAEADRYARLADALAEHGAATVADLPDAIGKEVLGR